MAGNFVQIRRGILEHIRRRSMSPTEGFVYFLLLLEADAATGIAWTNPAIMASNYGLVLRSTQYAFERLAEKGYVRSFPKSGSHHPYPVLIDKYAVTSGGRKGLRLCADKSSDCRNPVYEPCEELVQEYGQELVQELAPVHIQDTNTSRKKTIVAQPSAGADSGTAPNGTAQRKASIAESVHLYFCEKVGKLPTRYRLTGDRRKLLYARVDDISAIGRAEHPEETEPDRWKRTEETLRWMVDRFAASDWHQGRDAKTEGRTYNGMEYLFAAKKWEKWIS